MSDDKEEKEKLSHSIRRSLPVGTNGMNNSMPSNTSAGNKSIESEVAGSTPSEAPDYKQVAVPLSPGSTYPPHFSGQPYYYQPQPPASPATPNHMNGYDIQSLLGQQQIRQSHYPAIPPLSPATTAEGNKTRTVGDDINFSIGAIPPASPLFPGTGIPVFGTTGTTSDRMDNSHSLIAPSSPALQYLSGPPPSPVISYGGMYSSSIASGSPEAHTSWSERSLQPQIYPGTNPTTSSHIQSIPYQQLQSRRSASFDGTELANPSSIDENGSGVYPSPGGATIFSQHQSWAYNTSNAPYGNIPSSTLHQHGGHMHSPPRIRQNEYREQQGVTSYFPAVTPGPPIQTTHHNKGPEGANLFIFHIPNHFTNLDMWHLFCHYGNLLSVRIMVEKDTGRSRGFGFVSYDSPDAAALAIKELNGFVIGNKRLKVQHKQIRQGEQQLYDGAKQPPLFPDGGGPARHTISPGVTSGNDITSMGHPAETGQVVPLGGTTVGSAEVQEVVEQKRVDGTILGNLDAIGEALPDVSN